MAAQWATAEDAGKREREDGVNTTKIGLCSIFVTLHNLFMYGIF